MSFIGNKNEYFVKEGTCFFRQAVTTNIIPYMFFGFNAYATFSSESPNKNIQVWKTLKDFSTLYAVKEYERENQLNEARISSLPDIYFKKYNEKVDYLDIKRYNNQLRRNLLKILHEENYLGWTTSVENTFNMELFLFGNTIPTLMKFMGYTDNVLDSKLYDYDYFSKSNIIIK